MTLLHSYSPCSAQSKAVDMTVYMMWIGAVLPMISITSKHPVAIAVVVTVVVAVFELSKQTWSATKKKQHNLWAWVIIKNTSLAQEVPECLLVSLDSDSALQIWPLVVIMWSDSLPHRQSIKEDRSQAYIRIGITSRDCVTVSPCLTMFHHHVAGDASWNNAEL